MRSEADDRGSVTAELAVALPVLMIVLAVAISAVTVSSARVRIADAAREAARAAARDDAGTARVLAARAAPGAAVEVVRQGTTEVATVRLVVHPLAGWLPSVTVVESAAAAVETPVPP